MDINDFFQQTDTGTPIRDPLADRILAAEYDLGIRESTPEGAQLASQALGRLIGNGLRRIIQ